MPKEQTELVAVFKKWIWRDPKQNAFGIGVLASGMKILGSGPPDDLLPGIRYKFQGFYQVHDGANQFKFQAFIQQAPHDRRGILAYFRHHVAGIGIGTVRAAIIFDTYGENCIQRLVDQTPGETHSHFEWMTLRQATFIQETFAAQSNKQETEIDLLSIFEGTGLHVQDCIKLAIKLWSIAAPRVIRENPFILLEGRFPGCGFLRADKIYLAMGHPADAITRQLHCACHALRIDRSGSTWMSFESVRQTMAMWIEGGIRAQKACEAAMKKGLLVIDGDMIAMAEEAVAEEKVAELVGELL